VDFRELVQRGEQQLRSRGQVNRIGAAILGVVAPLCELAVDGRDEPGVIGVAQPGIFGADLPPSTAGMLA